MHGILNILEAMNLKTQEVLVMEPSELSDIFPMAAYTVAGMRIVTQKCYIYVHE